MWMGLLGVVGVWESFSERVSKTSQIVLFNTTTKRLLL